MKKLVLFLFLAGLLLSCTLATGTLLLFQWPGFLVLALAGVLSLGMWRVAPRHRPNGAWAVGFALFATYLVAAAVLWIVSRNLRAMGRYKGALDGRPPSLAARFAWLLSLLSAWTGPFVVVFAVVALLLGLREKRRASRGQITRRSTLPAGMAMENALVLLVAALVLFALLVFAGALSGGADPPP